MDSHSKQRNEQHVIDAEAQDLLRSVLPKHWVLREYDLITAWIMRWKSLVRFRVAGHEKGNRFETLGEHLFLQLRGPGRQIEALSRFSHEET